MSPREEGDMRVADYVLGLMEPSERVLFERDMRDDPALAEEVADWRMRIAQLDAAGPPGTPRDEMLRRIEHGLATSAGDRVGGKASRDDGGRRRRLAFAALGAMLAVAAALAWAAFLA